MVSRRDAARTDPDHSDDSRRHGGSDGRWRPAWLTPQSRRHIDQGRNVGLMPGDICVSVIPPGWSGRIRSELTVMDHRAAGQAFAAIFSIHGIR